MTILVLDEQIAGKTLIAALRARGMTVKTLDDYGVSGRPDPNVVRTIGERETASWVLLTMDLNIVEEFAGFDWGRYAIAWVVVREDLRGAPFEESKQDIVHHHVRVMLDQRPGDHHTYTEQRHSRSRPSLTTWLKRNL